jgi:uncharacterized membrane protein YbaN (DUF454 family)
MKWLVGALACLCIALVFWFPRLVVVRTLLQLVVCLVVLLYLKVRPYGV